MTYKDILSFHGHECPGIAIGYRMTTVAMDHLSSTRSSDEELVAIVENDACGVDAVQCITGCTFGKGNLIFRDYGKQVYTIYSRSSRKGVRVVFHGAGVPDSVRENRNEFTRWLLGAAPEAILSIETVSIEEPEPAKIRISLKCAICGESVMDSRIREMNEKSLCIPCFEKEILSNDQREISE